MYQHYLQVIQLYQTMTLNECLPNLGLQCKSFIYMFSRCMTLKYFFQVIFILNELLVKYGFSNNKRRKMTLKLSLV